MSIKGKFLGHSAVCGFYYEYTCERCGRAFRNTAPDINAPALCHQCATGSSNENRRRTDRRRRAKHLPHPEVGTQ